MKVTAKLQAFSELISHLFHRPVTARESFGFLALNSRILPRRDESRCTGCGACNERCSSGSTSITDTGNQRTVSIESLRCIFCARCADVCPEKALNLSSRPFIEEERQMAGISGEGDTADDRAISIDAARRYASVISLSHGIHEPHAVVNTQITLQTCRVCGDIMPVTEKQLHVLSERVFENLKPENAAIVRKDMELYLTACISCRRKNSIEWNTHPRKFI
jgi:hydrogenase-4 component H